ncbi:MAG: glycosyltransferase family 1 protein [Candidatus Eisenbacteria bacterium]|jgi:glycosyltransferase involved in cell wall biosynthesis|nr:glycosyltransferase family 1 protein [Candidatus Eisenbacteria bacterium]
MRVAYFTESLPPNTDGVVRTLCNLTQSLDRRGVDYRFFSPFKPDRSFSWSHRVYKLVSLPVALYSEYRLAIPYLHPLDRELDRYRPDLIHVTSPSLLGMFGADYARRRGLPAVSSYHTHFVSYLSYYGFTKVAGLGWRFLHWFHNQFEKTYAPSPSAVRELTERGIRRVELWQRGVDLDRFSPAYRSDALRRSVGAADRPLLLFVGRLVKEKDLDDLVAASRILEQRGCPFALAIVGDGPMRDELQHALPYAQFPGYQHGDLLSTWYASADLFVFPSTTETFGNVVLEAFASGLPAIGVAQGGVADIITPGKDGVLACPHDPQSMANAVESLILDGARRVTMGRAARDTAASYSWDAINAGLIRSYCSLWTTTN